MKPLPLIQEGKVNVIIDGQWGSTGKGKLAGWLYTHHQIDVAVCDFMPNAGHTYVDNDGESHMFRQLPIGALFDVPLVLIGPHAAIDKDVLLEEAASLPDTSERLVIHPMVPIVSSSHRASERAHLSHIASTMKGGHAASAEKMWRDPSDVRFVGEDPDLKHLVGDTHQILQDKLRAEPKTTVLIESSQGFDLGLNHGWKWPFVTGRDCMVGRLFDNAGVSPARLGSVIASLRTFPIRVGHTKGGHSGPHYDDQIEVSWEQMSKLVGKRVCEKTTVTGRTRRVFTFSRTQLTRFLRACEPTHAFLNFINYLPLGSKGYRLYELACWLEAYDCLLILLGTGPRNSDMEIWSSTAKPGDGKGNTNEHHAKRR